MERAPFFHARFRRGEVASCGLPHYSGGRRLENGDGVFAEWHWDGAALHVRGDRYGAFPLFYFEAQQEFCVSPSLLTLVSEGASTAPDYDALAAFLRLGFFLGEDTPLRDVRVLPPDADMVWRNGVLQVSSRLSFARAASCSRDDAIDAFVPSFRRAIDCRLSNDRPVLLPLSGGRDSRHILFALLEAGAPPEACVTVRPFPPRHHLEVPIAAAVADAAGVRHVVVEQRAPRVEAERRKNILTHFCSDEHAHFLALADYLSTHASTSYDGLAGDMLTGQSSAFDARFVELLDSGRLDLAAEWLFESYDKRAIEEALSRMIAPDLYERVSHTAAVARVVRELARHVPAPNRALSFLFWNRTRRELALAPYALMSDVTVFSPYLDHALFDLLMGLPPSLLLDHRFHTEAISRAYPRVRHIPFEDRDSVATPGAFFRRTAIDLAVAVISSPGAVRRRYVLPRLTMAAVTGQPAYLWFLPLVVYLGQLAERMRGAASPAQP